MLGTGTSLLEGLVRKAIGAMLMGAAMATVACGDSGGGASGGDDGDAGAAGSGGSVDAGTTGSGGSADAGATGSGGSADAGTTGSGGSADAGTTGSGGSAHAGTTGSGGSGDAGATGSGGAADAGTTGSGGAADAGAAGTGAAGSAGAAGSGGVGTAGTAGSAGFDLGGAAGSSGSASTETGGSGGGTVTTPTECPDIGLDPNAGTIYYACDCGTGADTDCVAGDDGNAGTSPDAPWQTWEYARTQFANLEPGDSIAFCRGGGFDNDGTAGTRWVNGQCLADNPCVVRDYEPPWASGDEARPRINALAGQHGFALEDGGNSNHEEGYTFLNLDLRGSGDGNGFFIYNDIDDVLICNVAIDGFSIGVHAAGSNPADAGSDARNERINVLNSSITNNPGQGWLGACNGCGVDYTYFDNNGSAQAVYNHNIYFSGASGEVAVGMHAIGNELNRSAIVGGECAGVSFVVHGEHDGLLIENNLVREDVDAAGGGCWGIAVDTGYGGDPEQFRNIVIRGNRVVNVGNVAIGLDACEDCVVENNVIIQEQSFGARGIAVPDRDREADDLPMTGVTVRNNSIYFGPDASGTGIYLGGEGTGHVLVSNAVYYAGTNDGWNCLDLDLALSSYDAVDNNLCYFPNAPGGEWMNGVGTLADWQSSSSLDASSVVTDPGFVSTTGPDFDLSPESDTSPLVDSGHPTLSSNTDLTGTDRDDSPDIGAYER